MNNTLIPIYLILGFLVFRFLLTVFYPCFVFLHELGHAVAAVLVGAKNIRVRLGPKTESPLRPLNILGIQVSVPPSLFKTGSTDFEKLESPTKFAIVALSGPIMSLLIAVAGIVVWQKMELKPWQLFILSSAWLANFHILFNACWPFQRTPDQQSDLRNLLDNK